MFVIVTKDNADHYVDVQGIEDRDSARRIAFRLVHNRIEKDFNELVHSTLTPPLQISVNAVNKFILGRTL